MAIKAVVFDIGGVLEHVADDAWPEVWIGRTVVVLTQRTADETGMPGVCEAVLAAARDGTLAVSG